MGFFESQQQISVYDFGLFIQVCSLGFGDCSVDCSSGQVDLVDELDIAATCRSIHGRL